MRIMPFNNNIQFKSIPLAINCGEAYYPENIAGVVGLDNTSRYILNSGQETKRVGISVVNAVKMLEKAKASESEGKVLDIYEGKEINIDEMRNIRAVDTTIMR